MRITTHWPGGGHREYTADTAVVMDGIALFVEVAEGLIAVTLPVTFAAIQESDRLYVAHKHDNGIDFLDLPHHLREMVAEKGAPPGTKLH